MWIPQGNKSRTITHIVRGVRGLVSFKANIGFLQFFQPFGAPGHGNFLDRSSGGLRRFHGWLSFWHGRFISSYILSRRSSGSISLRVLIITAKKAKGNMFYTTQKGKKANTRKS
jgi:hypothetical protein